MDFGVYMFATDYAIRIDDLARALEERGFESLWIPEHTHIPVSRRSPFPMGGPLPKEYWHTLDPFVALGAAAAVTTELKIATGICLLIERDTITTAKEVASLDLLSDGRMLFGIGAGWNAEEMENHGTDFSTRFRRLREQVAAMKEIWSKDEPQYHGQFVDFDAIWSWPKPVQKPHPPIILGGNTRAARQRVVDFCDGWVPVALSPQELEAGIEDLGERAAGAGRDRSAISVSLYGAQPKKASLEAYARAGLDRAIFPLPSQGRDKVLPKLDEWAKLLN